jgi:hypothetical protein
MIYYVYFINLTFTYILFVSVKFCPAFRNCPKKKMCAIFFLSGMTFRLKTQARARAHCKEQDVYEEQHKNDNKTQETKDSNTTATTKKSTNSESTVAF